MLPSFTLILLAAGSLSALAYVPPAPGASDAVLLRELVARMGTGLAGPTTQYLPSADGLADEPGYPPKAELYEQEKLNSLREAFGMDGPMGDELELSVPRDIRDGLDMGLGREEEPVGYAGDLAMHPSLRDREYMSHGHLLGNVMSHFPPGSSYGTMRIKPSGGSNPAAATTERKTEGVLPAYCNPPNPCPLGYTAADNCAENFQNTAAFSRNYQSQQECMCDTEHMFDCPDSTRDTEIGALARSIQNEGVLDSTLDKIMEQMRRNPYLQGDKLPVAAKKGVLLP